MANAGASMLRRIWSKEALSLTTSMISASDMSSMPSKFLHDKGVEVVPPLLTVAHDVDARFILIA